MALGPWSASAPSNIALIKYMGKSQVEGNLATNSSLSYTLNHLRSFVRISLSDRANDSWAPLEGEALVKPELSEKGQERYLAHLQRMKSTLGVENYFFKVESANNFPSDCGLASSASSFAALTMALAQALSEISGKDLLSIGKQADLSRQASGSSCRSFYEAWVLWKDTNVYPVETSYPKLEHLALIVESGKKEVSSSEAHKRVISSLLFKGRIERAEQRITDLTQALREKNWELAYQITWAEFWDMHALFETSSPPFSYMLPESLQALRMIQTYWVKYKDGPLVTMDAGANVHLLFRPDQYSLQTEIAVEASQFCRVMDSRVAHGF